METIVTQCLVVTAGLISLSQFFAEEEMIEYTPELKELFEAWQYLTPEQKEAVVNLMKAMRNQ